MSVVAYLAFSHSSISPPNSTTKERSGFIFFPLVDWDTTQQPSRGIVPMQRAPKFLLFPYPLVRMARHWHRWQLRMGYPSYIFIPSFLFGGLDLAFLEFFIQGLRRSKACPVTLVTAEIPTISFRCWGGGGRGENAGGDMAKDGTTTTKTACGTGKQPFLRRTHARIDKPAAAFPRRFGFHGRLDNGATPRPRANLSTDTKLWDRDPVGAPWGERGAST